MKDRLISLLGKSIESEEIKALYSEWGAAYPKRTSCTADNPNIKGKVEKDCIRLYFGRGGNSRHLKPIPTTWEGGYIAILTTIEFTKKRKGGIPFGVEYAMTDDELTAILGTPIITNVVGQTTIWRKQYDEKYEFVVNNSVFPDGSVVNTMNLSFVFEPDLYTMEDYEKAGF